MEEFIGHLSRLEECCKVIKVRIKDSRVNNT